jgi:hypothetical protein
MGKTVYCISNGSPTEFPQNTLTSFGNKFPFFYDYAEASQKYRLQVAVDSIGFSLKFNQRFLPEPMINPCIIIEFDKDKTLRRSRCRTIKNNKIERCSFPEVIEYFRTLNTQRRILRNPRCIHFENSVLNMSNVSNVMKESNDIWNVSTDDDLNTITLKYKDRDFNMYFNNALFPFVKVIPSLVQTPSTVTINNDSYEVYECNSTTDITIDLNGVFSLNLPKIIKVKCKNIRDQIFNNRHEKDLLVFCPQIDKQQENKSDYFFHEFEARTYCSLENTILDQISFDLVNEYNEPLNLDTGIPTLLKLDIIAMEKSKKSFNIRVASDNINRSNFTIKLPQTLHFDENWRVSLSSINLPNTFNTFSTDEDHLKIIFIYSKGAYRWGYEHAWVTDGRIEFKLPNKIYTKKELVDQIHFFLTNNVLNAPIGDFEEVSPEDQPNVETEEIRSNTSYIKLTMKSQGILLIPNQIVDLFGGDVSKEGDFEGEYDSKYLKHEDGYSYFFKLHRSVDLINPNNTKTFHIKGDKVNMSYYQPSYIMLYTDIIKPIAVSGVYMNIMKIFPTSPLKLPYVIKEFKNIEYLSLNNYEIKEINFQLRNHAGDLISFERENRNPVILNLHFTNYTT